MKNCLLILLICISFSSFGQKAIITDDSFSEYALEDNNVFLLEDKEDKLTINDIVKLDSAGSFNPIQNLNLGSREGSYWGKILIDNQKENFQLFFIPVIDAGNLSFYFNNGDGWQEKNMNFPNFYQRNNYLYKTFLFDFFLGDAKQYTIYYKLNSNRTLINFEGTFFEEREAHKKIILEEVIFGVMYGMLAIMILYNLFLFITLKELIYLKYVIAITFNLVLQLYFNNHHFYFFDYSISEWIGEHGNMFLFISIAATAWFSADFLEINKKGKSFNFLFLCVMYLNLLFACLALILPINWIVLIANVDALLSAIIAFAIGVILFFRGVKNARFYVLAWSVYLIVGVMLALTRLNILPTGLVTYKTGLLSSVIQVVLLSIALADKINLLRRERNSAQQTAIQTAKENEQLILKQKETLEKKVTEKTKELQLSNNELQVSNEELTQTQEEIATQRDVLEERNKALSEYQLRTADSINAAKLIQNSILPSEQKISRLFKNHFLIYKPKDVVSGDFYWMAETETEILFIVADCTGHGVPGAFMTLISRSILEQIILVERETSPKLILEKLHDKLYEALQQGQNQNKDGLDISILNIEKEDNEAIYNVTFGGAKQSITYTNGDELVTLKGSRKRIGGFRSNAFPFEEHKFSLSKGAYFYLYSDGFVDQNNNLRRRFSSVKFHALLDDIRREELSKQKTILETTLLSYMEGVSQRDDITVVGLELDINSF